MRWGCITIKIPFGIPVKLVLVKTGIRNPQAPVLGLPLSRSLPLRKQGSDDGEVVRV